MNARRGASLIATFLCIVVMACNGGEPPGEPSLATAAPDPGAEGETADAQDQDQEEDDAATGGPLAPLSSLEITVYFPSQNAPVLVPETREIFDTASPVDRAKQILADLISGPSESIGAYPALPPGTRLRQVYVLEGGIAWVDFTADLKNGLGGGTHNELLAVYAVVNSLALNLPEIQRVGILIDGRVSKTLGGHLDLSRPLPANTSYILGASSARPMTADRGAAPHTGNAAVAT